MKIASHTIFDHHRLWLVEVMDYSEVTYYPENNTAKRLYLNSGSKEVLRPSPVLELVVKILRTSPSSKISYMSPQFAHGKICYLVIPAIDVERSATFFEKAFGWHILRRPNGELSFDDSVNQVSGTWVTGLNPHTQFGISIHLMVFDMNAALKTVVDNGGVIIETEDKDRPEITATIADPAGNIFGLYQHQL